MPPPPGNSDPDLWIMELPQAKETSLATLSGGRVIPNGTTEHIRENEDRYYTCKFDGVQLYLVLDGHNGSRACEFAMKRIPSLLLQRDMGEGGERATEALRYTFENTEKNFFMMLDPSITRKMGLQMEMQEKGGTTSLLAYQMFPEKVEELQRLEEQINGGTTAVVALILNNRQLWVANVGDSRAILCYLDGGGKLHAEQISEDHNTKNDQEIARLVECGLDSVQLRRSGRLGIHQNTRSIGDYSIKGGYKDHDILAKATKEPGSAEPFISHPPLDITTIRGFLLLMSDGLYDAHAAVTNSPQTVNHDIALLVQRYLDHAHSMEQVAEKVAAETAANFRAMVQRSGESASMDDVTLIVRNLGYPLGQISRNSTTSPLHQSPFNFGQSSQSQPQLAPTGPAPSYENPSYLQQQQVSPQQTPSAISHHQHPPSSPPSATNPSGFSPYTPPSAAHPSVLTGHLDQVESHPNNSTYSPQSQQGSHYPHVTTGGHGNVQYGPIPAGTAGAQSLRKSSSDPRVHAPFNQAAVERAAQQQSYQSFQPQSQENNSQHWSQLSNTSQSPSTPAVYENWDVRRRAVEGNSAASVGPRQTESSVTELSANLGATNAGTSLATAHQKSPRIGYNHGLHSTARATNADSQFQSVQHASGVSSQPEGPNFTVNWNGATDKSGDRSATEDSGVGGSSSGGGNGGLLRKQSTLDDESWMYNHDEAAAQPTTSFVETLEENEEVDDSGRRKEGDTTEMVELELEGDRERDVEEEEEEEGGLIKPIIKFDKFPPDLSWDQI